MYAGPTVQYGFVIDQDRCIGCHACTTACKAENEVPVGSFRTWVKYTERGTYPTVKRHFAVLRCNHCTKPPCVDICPVNALSKRPDGIVDIDRDACIGCRACMQACPYDALYLNEDHGAVEKCHFCAHRVEQGLQPACVTVCPVGAIIPGDFDDPSSQVSVIRKEHLLTARRVEQGTGPNVLYKGADEAALRPGSMGKPESFLWSERPPYRKEPWPKDLPVEKDAKEVLNAEHKVEWGWQVALYLVTKGIAGGTAMLAPFLPMLGVADKVPWWYPETVALVFTAITVFLLIEDLKKPLHFYKLFTRPNWKSWLVKGGIVLTAFGAVSAGILLIGLIRHLGPIGLVGWAEPLRWVNSLLGAMTAGYTAFLFWQCKGRDLWESRLLLPHLLVQAAFCGAVVMFAGAPSSASLGFVVAVLAALHILFARHELESSHTENAKQGSALLSQVRVIGLNAWGVSAGIFAGLIVGTSLALIMGIERLGTNGIVLPIAGMAGLYLYEHAYIRAGQLPPLS